MKTVRWGIIGTANIFFKSFLLPMQKSPLMELYGVASRDPEKSQRFCHRYNIPKSYPSYEDLLADRSITAVYIPLPNHLHLEWIQKAADAGKHILCEKPLTLNAREAEEAIAYTRNKGVLLMEAFMYRFHPQWIRARELVETGNIGSIRALQTFFSYNNIDPHNIRNIRHMGGGAILDIGCYAVSTARYLFGREPLRAVSLVNRDPAFETDILTSGMLDFGDGHAVFTVGTQSFPHQKVDIIGSGGRIEIELPFNTYTDTPVKIRVTTGIGTRELVIDTADQYELQCTQFSEAVIHGRAVPTPPEDALNNMRALDALFRSEETGTWETLGS